MRGSDPQPSDAAERSIAADIHRSVIVQAPAGSGKTTLLVERFINLLGVVDRPEEILAITFTRKAAAEMHDRVLSALADGSARAQAIHARSIDLGWHLENQPSRLRIQTIDAFCTALAHRLPVPSGLGEGLRIVEDAEPFYAEAINHLFERLRTADPLNSELVALLALFDNDYTRTRASMISMLARRDQWLDVVSSTLRAGRSDRHADGADDTARGNAIARAIERGIESLHQSALGDLVADLSDDQRTELAANAASAAQRLGRTWPWTDLPDDIDGWCFIADLVATQDGKPRSRLGKAQGFDDTRADNQLARARLKALVEDLTVHGLIGRIASLRALPAADIKSDEVKSIVAVSTGLALAALELGGVFRRHRVIDFAELTFAAHRALGEPEAPTDLALALDYRIKHLLVDEFQDTSATQYRLLARLVQEWQTDDARSLFIVGDPMQSIYRFRDADVALFQRTRRNGIAAVRTEPIDLTSNFRSSSAIVDWCNDAFRRSFGSAEDPVLGRVAFSPSMAINPNRDSDGCRVVIASDDGDGDESSVLVERVERIRRDHPNESIAILARNRGHLTQVLTRLTARRIPWVGTDIQSLSERPVISDLMSLVKALSSDDDRIAWLALLRTPFIGLSLRDLEIVAQAGDGPAAVVREAMLDDALSADGRARLLRIRPVLQHAERVRGQMRIRAWIENAFIHLGGIDAYDDVDVITHAQRFLNVIDEGHSRTLDITSLERSVERLFAESSRDPNSVDVMTIHRAKGLEFDHVLVPGLHRVGRVDDPPTVLWRPEGNQLLLGVRGTSDERSVYRWLRHEERHREANEQIRLLYVAATRARHSLHLFAVLESDGDGLRRPQSRSLLSPIWHFVADQAEVVRQSSQKPDAIQPTRDRLVLPAGYLWRRPTED